MVRYFSLIVISALFYNFSEAQGINNKKDTIVIEFDDNNRLLIPDMQVYEPELMSKLKVSYPKVQRIDKIEFELSFWGIDGDIMNNLLIFETGKNFMIISLEYKFSRALYFSEDGSDGTWAGSDEFFSDWRDLSPIDPYIYRTPDSEEAKPFPVIPENEIINAEKQLEKNPLLDYSEHTGSFIIKINYSLKNKNHNKEIIFYYSYGD